MDTFFSLIRPVDSYGPIYLNFAPRDVVWSGWVGDQDPTFEGLQNGNVISFVYVAFSTP